MQLHYFPYFLSHEVDQSGFRERLTFVEKCKRKYEEITIKTVYCKKNDVLPSVAVYLRFRQDSTNARIHFGAVPAGISRLRADFESAVKGRSRVRARAFRKEEKSFYKFYSLPFAFLLCPTALTASPLSPCPRNGPPSRRARSTRANPAYSLDPVPFRFSLSRPISAEDIRSAIRHGI